jgi:large subunit ribosomal protein L29
MKAAEIRGLNDQQMNEQLTELHAEWRDLRFQEAVGKLMATSRIRQIRKTIARIHTIRTERELESEVQAALASQKQTTPASARQ